MLVNLTAIDIYGGGFIAPTMEQANPKKSMEVDL